MSLSRLVILGAVCALGACQTTTPAGPVVSSSPPAGVDTTGVMAVMRLGPEYVMLYDTAVMTQTGAEAFARQYCQSQGAAFTSIDHRSIAHPEELPNSGKAGFTCA